MYLTTRINGTTGSEGYVLIKTDTTGTVVSAWEYPVPHITSSANGPAICRSHDNQHVIIAGNTQDDLLAFKVRISDGAVIWSYVYDHGTSGCTPCNQERAHAITQVWNMPNVPNQGRGFAIFGAQNTEYYSQPVEKMLGLGINENGGIVWSTSYTEVPLVPQPGPYQPAFADHRPTAIGRRAASEGWVVSERQMPGNPSHGAMFRVDLRDGTLIDNPVLHFRPSEPYDVEELKICNTGTGILPGTGIENIGISWNSVSAGSPTTPFVMQLTQPGGINWVRQFDGTSIRGVRLNENPVSELKVFARTDAPTRHHLVELDWSTGVENNQWSYEPLSDIGSMHRSGFQDYFLMTDQNETVSDRFDIHHRLDDVGDLFECETEEEIYSEFYYDIQQSGQRYNWDDWAVRYYYPITKVVQNVTSQDFCPETIDEVVIQLPISVPLPNPLIKVLKNPISDGEEAWRVDMSESDLSGTFEITLIGITGRVHYTASAIIEEGMSINIPSYGLAKGIYIMHLSQNGMPVHSEKLLLE